MDSQTTWTLPPDAFYPEVQQQLQPQYSSSISGFFRKPSRIIKPSSRNISPRSSGRRKFNSLPYAPTRTRSVVDRRPTFPQWQAAFNQVQNRPTSWHTSSFDHVTPTSTPTHDQPYDIHSFNYLNLPFTTNEVNGVFTPLSMPVMDEPHIQDMTIPLDQLPVDAFEQDYPAWNHADSSQNLYWPQEVPKTNPSQFFSHNGYSVDYNNMYNQFQATKIDTAPASPAFLPIQNNAEHSSSLGLMANSGGEELVGMGLYDKPTDVRSSRLNDRLSVDQGSIGKGLKLEDSFEPPDCEDDDEDDQQDMEEEYSGTNSEHFQSLLGPLEDQAPVYSAQGLEGQSFYLEHDEEHPQMLPDFGADIYPNQYWPPVQHGDPYGWI